MKSVIVSKDEDFIQMSGKGIGPQIVWVTFGNASKATLIEKTDRILPQITEALEAGERIVEVR